MLCLVSKIMNTINIMCEAPLLKGNIPTTSVVDLNNPSSYPSLGSTRSLGSAPSEGGVSKHPGVLVNLELGGVLASEGRQCLDHLLPLASLSLRPRNTGSWKLGCGHNLPPITSSHPTPYHPSAPSEITQKASSITPTPNPPSKTVPTTSHKTSNTTINIRTATGGTKRIGKHPKTTSSPAPTYICDGIGCVFTTNSPYKFAKHQSIPHNWQPGSQNWCFQKAKTLALGNKSVGLNASCPTVFASTDIRVKKGELPPNVIKSKCVQEATPLSLVSPTIEPTPSRINSNSPTPTSTSTTTSSITSTPTTTNTNHTPISSPPTPPKLYFPVSYFLWKRKLPSPNIDPVYPPWTLFSKPNGKKITTSSHLKWDRRLHDGPTYSFGVNDPSQGYSSHAVTLTEGNGIPKFKEDGSWARYSHLLVPKTKLQDIPPNQQFLNSCYTYKSKRRVSRPKSGENTHHKAHGLSLKDHHKGLGKEFPSEVPCKRKHPTSLSPTPKLTSSTSTCPLTASSTYTSSTIQGNPLYVPYPSQRTKWTRPVGGCLRGGGPLASVTIKLIGSLPYKPINDSHKLSITCMDSVIECSLSLIEHHSNFLKNLLLESGSCR